METGAFLGGLDVPMIDQLNLVHTSTYDVHAKASTVHTVTSTYQYMHVMEYLALVCSRTRLKKCRRLASSAGNEETGQPTGAKNCRRGVFSMPNAKPAPIPCQQPQPLPVRTPHYLLPIALSL